MSRLLDESGNPLQTEAGGTLLTEAPAGGTGAAGLTGAGTLGAAGQAAYAGAGALAGAGSLSASATATAPGTAGLSGAGSVTAAGAVALTVTAAATGAGSASGIEIAPLVYTGAALTQNGSTAASETVTAPELAITPGHSGSVVVGAAGTGASGTAFSSPAGSVTAVANNSVVSGSNWAVFRSGSTTTSSTTYGWAAPAESSGSIYIAMAEILASGTLALDASTPAAASSASLKTITSAPFTPPPGAVIIVAVLASWSGSGAVTIALSDSASAYTWAQLSGTGTTDLTSVWAGIPKVGTLPGASGLSGAGSMTAAADLEGAAPLSGAGSLAAAGKFALAASLAGSGTMTATGSAAGASLSGSGSLGAQQTVLVPAAAGLAGSGTITAGGSFGAAGDLSGSGVLTAAAALIGAASLAGSGTLTAGASGSAVLSGAGTVTAWQEENYAALAGAGTLGISGFRLSLTVQLAGSGSMSIPQVAGGLVNGVGGVGAPQALPGSSQVAVAPPGSSNWQWLGTLGQVTALQYSFICPGGCDKLSTTIQVPAAYRTQLFNPGWKVRVTRGGHQVWDGVLDEPQPSASGWNLTAVGTGNLGANYVAYYSIDDTWPDGEPDEIINRAISRGLPWVNPGLNASPYASQYWMGQATDPGSQSVAAFLSLITTRGGLLWYVNSQPGGTYNGDDLSVVPLPTSPNRLLVVTTPVARTLGGDINSIFVRYMSVADDTATNTAASYNVELVQNAASVAAHGELETYIDLSDVGVMTVPQVQQLCYNIFAVYQRASFAGPFTASYGQLLNLGGQPIDPGTDQAGTMVRMILTDYAYGGEVSPGPIEWIVGSYQWDDFAQTATVTPYQTLDQSLTGLLSMENTIMTPITTAST